MTSHLAVDFVLGHLVSRNPHLRTALPFANVSPKSSSVESLESRVLV